ncbi:Endonuclease [Tenacibaculum sp. 190130A14a]|uniref:Endonuclease n=1 Tax=Tenacibaculum polynesiense TaxID=3137857 RepID=A0ABM9P9P9_9FLAO
MKKVYLLGLLTLFFVGCGGNDSDVVKPDPEDKVVAVNDAFEATENTPTALSGFLSNDTYKEGSIKLTFDTTSSKGATIAKEGNNFRYTPATDFVGADTFTYTICSTITTSSCSTATITVNVKDDGTSTGGNAGSFNIPSALASYYSSVDFTKTGSDLREALATVVINSHSSFLSYTPGVWNALKESDLDPTNSNKVLLVYGYNDSDGNAVTDRTRGKDNNGGSAGSDWNREHVYPRSLGTPNLGSSGPGSDAHHLRPADVTMNSNRGNKKFVAGSGNAGDATGGWYPGEEWKGDVARMMMYMYLRYGSQCLPKNVATGTANSSDSNMINLLLEWNAADPISDFEKNRNNVLATKQGNRNPFIDNPYLATVIWGQDSAENTWK